MGTLGALEQILPFIFLVSELLSCKQPPSPPIMWSSAPPRYVLPPDVIEVDSTSSNWKEYRAGDGSFYYFNSKTKISSWEKPVELMDPIERADALTLWKEFCTPFGERYYYNNLTKESVWRIPDELKVARELIIKASKFYQIYKEKELLDICSEEPESGDEHNEFEETKFLCDWLQHHLSDKVDKVQVSKLLMSPFALNSAKLGFAPELQRMLGSTRKLRGRLFFIINPDHPVIKELNAVLKIKHDSTEDKAVADFLYEVASISSGYAPRTPAELYSTIYLILEIGLTGRWGRSNGEASTGANSSCALAFETSGLDSNAMEGLLRSVLGILKFKLHNQL